MTFSDLRALTSFWLDDLQFGYFTVTQVNVWLNNAQKELQKKLINAGQNYYLKPKVKTTMVVNQRNYALPLDFKKINRLEILTNSTPIPNESTQPLLPITTNQQDLLWSTTGMPAFYSYNKSNLIIRPAPDSPYVMRLDYTYQCADMVLDTDVADAPEDYHELIALLAAQDGFIKDGRVNDLLLKKIGEYEATMKSDAQERNQDVPRSILTTGQDNSTFYW